MSRIGRDGCTQIYNQATGKDIPRVDAIGELEGYQLVSERPFTNPLYDAPFGVKWEFRDWTDLINDKEFMERAKKRYNETEYQMKIGRRSEGSRFQDAKDKPYIELAQQAGNTFLGEAPNFELLPENQQYALKTIYPNMEIEDTKFDDAEKVINKMNDKPDEKQKIQIANADPMDFVDKKLADIELYPTEGVGRVEQGSNLKINWEKEMGQPTNIISTKEGYMRDAELDTMINSYQRAYNKGRQIIGLYKEKPIAQQLKEATSGNSGDLAPIMSVLMNRKQEADKKLNKNINISKTDKERFENRFGVKYPKKGEKYDNKLGVIKKPQFRPLTLKNPFE